MDDDLLGTVRDGDRDERLCGSCGCHPEAPWYCESCIQEGCPCGEQSGDERDADA